MKKESFDQTILFVDQSRDFASLIKVLLEGYWGYNVLTASNSEDAINIAINKHPDFIIMEQNMPRMKGAVACRMIKKNKATKDIPVIGFCGHGNHREFFRAGADWYIPKPCSAEDIHNTLEMLQTRKKSELKLAKGKIFDAMDIVQLRNVTEDNDTDQKNIIH